MIHVNRNSAPAFLSSDKVTHAIDYLRKNFVNVLRQERLRFDDELIYAIRPDLLRTFHNKCAYCETKLTEKEALVDNFRPRAGTRGLKGEFYPNHYWWLAYEWDNLMISCEVCSLKYKRDFFPLKNEHNRVPDETTGQLSQETPLLLNPCIDNPEKHLFFEENGTVTELSARGKVTIDIMGLNRKELVQRRKTVAFAMITLLDSTLSKTRATDQTVRGVLNLVQDLHAGRTYGEYTAVQLCTFEKWYERNQSAWEAIKRQHNDQQETKRNIKAEVGREAIQSIEQVTEQLSGIKRFSIKSIYIENFKSIEQIYLDILPVSTTVSRESWLMLLGDNGTGKSSILQAITLALAGSKQLKKSAFRPIDYLRKGQSSGKVVIQSYEHDKPVELSFDTKKFTSTIENTPAFVLAYGSTRLMPKGPVQPAKETEPYLNIKNLFDYTIALHEPRSWLSSLSNIEWKDRVRPALFDLLDLKDGDELSVKNRELHVKQYDGDHDLENNSDGYKSVVALACDMMQTLSIDNASYDNSYGIVLLDELGNHLHPRWRMKIAGALRKAFPKIQFIVTSHEPLCLRGLSHGEVVVLARDSSNHIQALDRKLLPDHNSLQIDQLLTSDLFGLISVLDDATEKMYADYYALLSIPEEKRSENDVAKIKALSENLSKRELLVSSPATQAVFQLATESYVALKQEGFKTKQELKEKTLSKVRMLIAKNKNENI
jgi:uncharacterized protein (TIGR02646 family)